MSSQILKSQPWKTIKVKEVSLFLCARSESLFVNTVDFVSDDKKSKYCTTFIQTVQLAEQLVATIPKLHIDANFIKTHLYCIYTNQSLVLLIVMNADEYFSRVGVRTGNLVPKLVSEIPSLFKISVKIWIDMLATATSSVIEDTRKKILLHDCVEVSIKK